MKTRFTALLTVLLLLTALIAGCQPGDPSPGGTNSPPPGGSASPSPGGPSEGGNPPPPPAETEGKITYAIWGDREIAQMEIDNFNKVFPKITVELVELIPGVSELFAAAGARELPDVFWVSETPTLVTNKILYDLKPLLDADPDFSPDHFFHGIGTLTTYGGRTYAVPLSFYGEGVVYINKDMLADNNIPFPAPDWTYDEFVDILQKLTRPGENQFALESSRDLRLFMYQNINPSLGYHTFCTETMTFNFTDPAYTQACEMARDIAFNQKQSLDFFTREEQMNMFGQTAEGAVANPLWQGKVAMAIGTSLRISQYAENANFDWDILPLPKVETQRLALIPDYIGVSAATEQIEAAYEFVKWMSFSGQGWMDRLDIYADMGKQYLFFPVTRDREVWDKFLASPYIPNGMTSLLNLIPGGYVEGFKWLPGWDRAVRASDGLYGRQFFEGTAFPGDHAAEMEAAANREVRDAMDALAASQG
jgi:multiple sugar transport system substrate-binding protein